MRKTYDNIKLSSQTLQGWKDIYRELVKKKLSSDEIDGQVRDIESKGASEKEHMVLALDRWREVLGNKATGHTLEPVLRKMKCTIAAGRYPLIITKNCLMA